MVGISDPFTGGVSPFFGNPRFLSEPEQCGRIFTAFSGKLRTEERMFEIRKGA